MHEQPQGGRRHKGGFGIFAAALNLDADAGAPAELERGEVAAGFAYNEVGGEPTECEPA